jgi:hypothetical protein
MPAIVDSQVNELPDAWHAAPRRWGHPLHTVSSYMAMFPPTIPHLFIRWLTRPGDVVYDPFSGRGTTPLEACLLGRRGFGSDANPLAWVLTSARVETPTSASVNRRLRELRSDPGVASLDRVPDDVRILFDDWTLRRLLYVRDQLNIASSSVDRFLMAVLLGSLHGNANADGSVRGLTVPMPNTFAMSPNYIRRFIHSRGLAPPTMEPLDLLQTRTRRVLPVGPSYVHGKAWIQDARTSISWPRSAPPAKLVFSSPPYLQVMKYGKYNWIRLWLLGHEASGVDSRLVSTSSLGRYLAFMVESIRAIRSVVREDGVVCLVVGDVVRSEREVRLADEVASVIPTDLDLTVEAVIEDRIPVEHKVSRIWRDGRVRATRTDRILILRGPKCRGLPSLPRIDWR